MADLISEIVSQEALEQVTKLTALLKDATGQMDLTIAAAADFNKSLGGSSLKSANDAINNLNNTTEKLIQTESERLNIERQIKAEGEKMAANVKVTSTAIDAAAAKYKMFANSQKELAQYIMETDRRLAELKDELKKADTSASNYVEATARMKVEQAKLKVELSEATKELKRTVAEQKFADDSMKGMSVRLLQLKDVYSQFTEVERNSDFGLTIAEGINELDEKMKGLDKSIGDNQRSVGNYEVSTKRLRTQLMDIADDLARQKIQYRESETLISKQAQLVQQLAASKGKESDEYKQAVIQLASMKKGYEQAGIAINQLEQQGGRLQDVYSDARRSIKGAADDAGNTKAMAEGVGVLANSFQVFQAGMAAVGLEGEDMMKVYAKMMILQQGFNSLTQITNALQSESVLRLKLKTIWDKTALAFTQKRTAATIEAAAATGGLAAAEGVATTTSWTLAGSIKAVGVAIKSIPVIGWILAAVAALGTLTVLLYKHLQAEKELTAEQENRKRLSKDLTEINQKANESTLENITRVKLLQKELGKVAKGGKEYQSIIKEINTLTGSQYDTIKATPAEIAKGTKVWIEQYKVRAKGEAIIQKMVENELAFQKLKNDVQFSSDDERKSFIDQLLLTPDQKKELLKSINLMKSNTTAFIKQNESNKIQNYLRIAETNMNNINDGLEKQITLEGMLTNEKEKQSTIKTDKPKDQKADIATTIQLLKLRQEVYGASVELERKIGEESLANLMKEYEEKKKIKGLGTDELIRIDEEYALKEKAIWQTMNTNIKAINDKNIEDQKKNTDDKIELLDIAIERTYDYIEALNKLAEAQEKANNNDKEKQVLKDRIAGTGEMLDSFANLGAAIAQNIEDEKRRIKVEQRIAQIQIALSHAIAIAQILVDGGDPYTKAVRIIANLAAVAAGFVQAQAAISQANSVQAYADGTDYHKGGAAIVGEGGQPELITIAGRNTWITEPTYFPNLPVGASVTPLSDMEQSKNMNDYWLEKIANGNGGSVNIDVSGRILPSLRKDMKVIRFANKLITARS